MSKFRKNKKNEDSMMCVKDMEDLALELRNSQKKKENLQNLIDLKQAEVDLSMDILNASTRTEIEECISNSTLTNLVPITKEKEEMYHKYNELDGVLAAKRFSGMIAKLTSKGVMVEFLPTNKETFPEKLLLLLSKNEEDNTFSVVDHNLVDFVPVDELVENYLNGPKGNVKSFVTHVSMYTSQMIKRHNMFESVRTKLKKIHHNADRTKLFITLDLQQEEDIVFYEFILHYHPLDIVPYKVTSNYFDGAQPNEGLKDLVQELKEKLYEGSVYDILGELLLDESVDNSHQAEESIEGSEFSSILG